MATNSPSKHLYLILSANFEIEPLIKTYVETYPDGEFTNYQIVFRSEDERPNVPYSYIIVTEYRQSLGQQFWPYLDAWCKVNRGKWVMSSNVGAFPDFTQRQVFRAVGEVPAK